MDTWALVLSPFAPSMKHGERMHAFGLAVASTGAEQRSRVNIGGRNRGRGDDWRASSDAVWRRKVAGIYRGGRSEVGGEVSCRGVHAHQLFDRMLVATGGANGEAGEQGRRQACVITL